MCGLEDNFDEDTWEYYDKVRDALHGLFEVLNIALDPKSVYYQCGVDNLKALKEGLLDLLMKDFDTLELQDTLRRIEFNVKKSLFFEDLEQKEQEKEVNEEKN
ncbi:MAG: hypothetical protein ACXAEX_20125 [Promethearchaeota archaeon]|jgi:hypothetical protein